MNSATIVQKLWNCCNVLRDDRMRHGDYVEQLSCLLLLKMADERSQPPWGQPSLCRRVLTGRRCWPKAATVSLTATAIDWKSRAPRTAPSA